MEINDNQILEAIRGQYKLSFMQIELLFKIEHPFDNDEIDKYSDKDFGTFVHEYIHYLQNISTPWGLYNSMVKYERIAEQFKHLQQQKNISSEPLSVQYTDKQNQRFYKQLITLGRYWEKKFEVDENQPITLSEETVVYERYSEQMKIFSFVDTNGTHRKGPLGAWMIIEAMSAIFQEFIDPSSHDTHSDIPYNLIGKYVKQNYPEIFNDKAKLISLLYSSLFSMNPGLLFDERLKFANEHLEMTGPQLFDDLVNNLSIHIMGKKMDISSFFNDITYRFSIILEKLIQTPLDYISEILKRININTGFVPIVTIISDGKFDRSRAKDLVSYLGVPYIYSKQGGFTCPSSIKNPNKSSKDIIALIGIEALSKILNNGKCELVYSCPQGDKTKPECQTIPWEGKECPITAAFLIWMGKK